MADGSAPDPSRHRNSHDGLLGPINNVGTSDGVVDTTPDGLELTSAAVGRDGFRRFTNHVIDERIGIGRENLVTNGIVYTDFMDRLHLRNRRSNQLIHQLMLVIMGLILMGVLDYDISFFTLVFHVVVLNTVGFLAIILSMLLHNRMPRAAGNLSRLGVVAGSFAVILATGMVLPMRDIWVIVLLCIITAAAILFGHINNIEGTSDGRVDTSPAFAAQAGEVFEPLGVYAVDTNTENHEVHVHFHSNQTMNVYNWRLYNTNVDGSHSSNRVSNQQIDPVMPGISGVQNNFRNRGTNQLIDQAIITITSPTSLVLMVLIMEHPRSHFPPLLYFVGVANIVGFIATLISMLLRNRMPLAAGHLSRLGTAAASSAVVMAMGLVVPRFIWAFVLLSIITVAAVLFGQTSHVD